MSASPSPLRRRRSVLALFISLVFLAATAGSAAAGPPDDRGKPDRGRDAYVAMGDSFAAGTGTGLPDLDPACQRSSLAYAPLIDVQRFDTSLTFVACGFGVTTQGLIDTQVQYLDRQTDVVTVSVGGNDLGFARARRHLHRRHPGAVPRPDRPDRGLRDDRASRAARHGLRRDR